MTENEKPAIVVVGSLHYDIMVDAPDRPRKGETVTGSAWRPKFGGKGGNQAVAAAKAGAEVRMVGAVGRDEFGRFLVQALVAGDVNATRVAEIPGAGSGMSVAIADSGGDYGAVIVSGANLLVDIAGLQDASLWKWAKGLILQNEMPDVVNIAAARAARANGATVCLNAAPYRPLPKELASLIDVLIVNAIEAEQLGCMAVTDIASAQMAAEALVDQFPTVIVTAGGDGVAGICRGEVAIAIPALPVTLVSTHGAGDVFVGSLVNAMVDGHTLVECLQLANNAAALHVSTPSRPINSP